MVLSCSLYTITPFGFFFPPHIPYDVIFSLSLAPSLLYTLLFSFRHSHEANPTSDRDRTESDRSQVFVLSFSPFYFMRKKIMPVTNAVKPSDEVMPYAGISIDLESNMKAPSSIGVALKKSL